MLKRIWLVVVNAFYLRNPRTVVLYQNIVALIGFMLLLLATPFLAVVNWSFFLGLGVLAILAESIIIPVISGEMFRVGFPIIVAAYIVLGPIAAAWLNVIGILVGSGLAQQRLPLFPTGMAAICTLVAGVLAQLVQQHLGWLWWDGICLSAVGVFVIGYTFCGYMLKGVYLRHFGQRRWLSVVLYFAIPLAEALTGILLAFYILGLGTVGMWFAVPLLGAGYLFRLWLLLSRSHKEIAAMYSVAKRLGTSLDLQKTLNLVVDAAAQIVEYDHCALYLRDELRDTLLPAVVRNPLEQNGGQVLARSPSDIAWRAVTYGTAQLVADTYLGEKVLLGGKFRGQFRSLLAIPLLHEGYAAGAIVMAKEEPHAFTPGHVRLLTIMASQAVMAVENAKQYASAARLSITDSLTGLYNHRYFFQRLEEEVKRAQRYQYPCSLVYIDLDNFKEYNDRFGHLAGDRALERVGQLLQDHVREVDIPCRYGGEEFAVILPRTDVQEAVTVAERIRQVIAGEMFYPYQGSEMRVHLTTSVGVATYPVHAATYCELVEKADAAAYYGKHLGKNRVVVCDNNIKLPYRNC